MRVHWTYSGCDDSQQGRIQEIWQSRQEELEAKTAGLGRSYAGQLRIAVKHSGASPIWSVQAALYANGHAFASDFAHDDLAEAMDATVGELAQQMAERLEDLDADSDGRSGLARLVPLFESFHAGRRSDAFFLFIVPLFRTLRRYAQREVRTRRALGELHREQLTVSDVLDEAMLLAWDRFPKRPKDGPLDLWLIQLIDQTIETGSRAIADESLEARRPEPSTEPWGSQQDQWVADGITPDTIELARLLPGAPGIEMWDELDVEIKQSQLDEIFERLTRPQRQVLMLHAVEGFDTATIADFEDRAQADVEQDLVAARSALERMFKEWEWPEIEERLERPSFKRSRRAHKT